jgi:hypothetical protein
MHHDIPTAGGISIWSGVCDLYADESSERDIRYKQPQYTIQQPESSLELLLALEKEKSLNV